MLISFICEQNVLLWNKLIAYLMVVFCIPTIWRPSRKYPKMTGREEVDKLSILSLTDSDLMIWFWFVQFQVNRIHLFEKCIKPKAKNVSVCKYLNLKRSQDALSFPPPFLLFNFQFWQSWHMFSIKSYDTIKIKASSRLKLSVLCASLNFHPPYVLVETFTC